MKIARLAGVMLVAVMALSLVVASAALAAPEFKPASGVTFTGSSTTTNKLVAGTNSITCTGNTSSGTISSATLAGGVTVSFTGCKSTGKEGSNCTIKSTNSSTAGTIVTKTLHGVLGTISKGTGSGAALLLLPVENKKFLTLESTKCTPETTVSGNVAGEVSPVGASQKTGKLVFAPGTSGESIKTITLSTGGAGVTPELEAFGVEASQETTESLTFSAALEVT